MKLLKKTEITDLRSKERKTEVDEGVKLARKVDDLRELVSKEQANIEKFRAESIKSLKEDIEKLSSEKNLLENEVHTIRQQKRKLLEIPVLADWSSLDERERHLSELQIIVEDQLLEDKLRKKLLEDEQAKLSLREDDIKVREQTANGYLREAEGRLFEATSTLNVAHNTKEKIDKEIKVITQSIIEREKKVASDERDITNREKTITMKHKELGDWERQLNDKYQTLLRIEKYKHD